MARTRTPALPAHAAWVVPRPDKPIPRSLKTAFTNVPGLRLAVRTGIYWCLEGLGYAMTKRPALLRAVEPVARANIRRNVEDKELRRRLTPKYRAGCKRILYSPNYYQGVANPKAELMTDRIARITPKGSSPPTAPNNPVDVIVWATGFHVIDSYTYFDIKGPHGEDLVDRWNRDGNGGAPRRRGGRYAEPVLSARAQYRAGAHVGSDHDRIADPLRGTGHRHGRTSTGRRHWRRARPPSNGTTTNCNATWPARCGTPVAAAVTISTSTGSTAACGAA